MTAYYIGVDPGVNGGIAILRSDGDVMCAVKMPATEKDILTVLMLTSARSMAILEKVSSSPQMGVVSAFTFGRGYGGIRMALAAAMIPFDEVTPGVWQRAMQCLTKGDKNVSKRRAQELFPAVKVTHAIADALLLAEFGRRREKG